MNEVWGPLCSDCTATLTGILEDFDSSNPVGAGNSDYAYALMLQNLQDDESYAMQLQKDLEDDGSESDMSEYDSEGLF